MATARAATPKQAHGMMGPGDGDDEKEDSRRGGGRDQPHGCRTRRPQGDDAQGDVNDEKHDLHRQPGIRERVLAGHHGQRDRGGEQYGVDCIAAHADGPQAGPAGTGQIDGNRANQEENPAQRNRRHMDVAQRGVPALHVVKPRSPP